MSDVVRVEWWPEDVLVLTLDRVAQRNALSPELLASLAEALSREGGRAGSVVLRGAGEQAFSAGFDLKHLTGDRGDLDADRLIGEAVDALRECAAPVLASIRGHCHGAAVELALSCDLRLAADDLRLSIRAVGLGVVYRYPFLARLVHVLGAGRAAHLLLAMPVLDAETALAWGLVGEVVAAPQLETRTRELAAELAASPRSAVRGTKAAFRLVERSWVAEADLEAALELRAAAAASPERRAALERVRATLGRPR